MFVVMAFNQICLFSVKQNTLSNTSGESSSI